MKERDEIQKVYYKLTDAGLARFSLDSEALMMELSLCKCQEVNYEGKGNQRSSKGKIRPNS